jgi:enamine deaminase RidA (YjgF/YER057c/UK114 family)
MTTRAISPGDMEAQMRQAWTNVEKLLAHYGATFR